MMADDIHFYFLIIAIEFQFTMLSKTCRLWVIMNKTCWKQIVFIYLRTDWVSAPPVRNNLETTNTIETKSKNTVHSYKFPFWNQTFEINNCGFNISSKLRFHIICCVLTVCVKLGLVRRGRNAKLFLIRIQRCVTRIRSETFTLIFTTSHHTTGSSP